jgi:hypothetical protein
MNKSIRSLLYFLAVALVVALALGLRTHAANTLPIDYNEDNYLRAGQEFAHLIRTSNWRGILDTNYRPEHPPLTKIIIGLSILSAPEKPDSITARDVAEAARRGDLTAQEIIKRSGTFVGIAIAGLINLINPSTVIIGGGVAQVGDLMTASIRQAVHERSLRASEHNVRITTAMLGRRSSLMGALIQAINVAIHAAIEQRSQYPKNVSPSLEIGKMPESNIS